ncbi:DUF2484 family protein [Loktanella sp. S4079]|uniref:DUF2484 family protein n=1 Tax=Loktanella sp. S4079 TaxID=579483 RepID=UPI0005FA1356|nr:DUF2484 family protein [Loktanella sp. S4079]KJZ20519.1 hypothetical protein TW80_06975 [Loktanella sp. S4079]
MALICVGLWWVMAIVMRLLPTTDNHWTRAYILIALGIPLVIWVWIAFNPLVAFFVFLSGCSVVRWPIYYFYLWLRRRGS